MAHIFSPKGGKQWFGCREAQAAGRVTRRQLDALAVAEGLESMDPAGDLAELLISDTFSFDFADEVAIKSGESPGVVVDLG